MEIRRFLNDNLAQSNCYVISYENDCYVVDPGEEKMTEVINYIRENNLNLLAVLLTHGHWDHILGIPSILEYKKVPIYVSEGGYEFLFNPELSLFAWSEGKFELSDEAQIITLKENDKLGKNGKISEGTGDGSFNFEIIETPGHSRGDICYYDRANKMLISGDTMFAGTYGRVDLPTSDPIQMGKSLKKLLALDEDVRVYPGHFFDTTIGKEKKYY
ncbi:MBL fold metallo-hydrolase [Leptotrichia sp. oral taxon 223]|uniref:MBL fold metallo-hydrolase n=1 Tax=Leptotrichia sp. oral taxon 223 TaxID=712363 RepID=UPI0015BB9493|nr:MBL fold metallo-hydrolase [Leptotrichia sp. oral taxon 223]NWO19856.1 MBL fold metallo-hydrolase [Leptotrichia sp. oral taxon 223]